LLNIAYVSYGLAVLLITLLGARQFVF